MAVSGKVGSSGQRELELKFDVSADQLIRLTTKHLKNSRHQSEPVHSILRSIYFDTPCRSLKAKRVSLRIRQIGNKWVQTLKSGKGVVAGLSSPMELELALSGTKLEIDKFLKSRLPAELKELLRSADLEPVFETLIERTASQIHSSKGDHVEIAFDKGVIKGQNSSKNIYEVEIELKAGNPEFMFGVAKELTDGENLRFSTLSKAETGYHAVDEAVPGPSVAVRYQLSKLKKNCRADDAYRALLCACACQIAHNWIAVLDGSDVDGPHQLRIGLRRLRSTLKAFDGVHRGKRFARLTADARNIALIVGELRDVDVLATQIVPAAAGALPKESSLADLQARLIVRQGEIRGNVTSQLDGDRMTAFLLRLGRSIEAPKWRSKRCINDGMLAIEVAKSALEDSWHNVHKWGKRLGKLSVPERHSMRKALKLLRYQTEAFASVFPNRKTKPFIRKLKNTQEIFGYLNDVAMAEKLSKLELADGDDTGHIDDAIAITLAWHQKQSDREWRRAKRAWQALKSSERFWQV